MALGVSFVWEGVMRLPACGPGDCGSCLAFVRGAVVAPAAPGALCTGATRPP